MSLTKPMKRALNTSHIHRQDNQCNQKRKVNANEFCTTEPQEVSPNVYNLHVYIIHHHSLLQFAGHERPELYQKHRGSNNYYV